MAVRSRVRVEAPGNRPLGPAYHPGCQEGYQSSPAAATLQQLGLVHDTDLDGGFIAWAAAGLPVLPGRDVPADCHIGMTRATV